MDITIRCSSFVKLESNLHGTAIHINSSNNQCFITYCSFIEIKSSSYPGCIFYESSSSLKLSKCIFESCSAFGGDTNPGNACYINSPSTIIEFIQCYLCSPSLKSTPGDSLIKKDNSFSQCIYLNTSYCYGIGGSSSISFNNSPDPITQFKYFNIINSADFSSFETGNSNSVELYYFNFINTTSNTDRIINNGNTPVTIKNSVFLNNFDKQFSSSTVYFDHCYTDSKLSGVEELEPTNYIETNYISFSNNMNKCYFFITPKFIQTSTNYITLTFIFVLLS